MGRRLRMRAIECKKHPVSVHNANKCKFPFYLSQYSCRFRKMKLLTDVRMMFE